VKLGVALSGLFVLADEEAFRDNKIHETVLPNLTAEDLKELGVSAPGHRRKLLDAISALRSDGVCRPQSVQRLCRLTACYMRAIISAEPRKSSPPPSNAGAQSAEPVSRTGRSSMVGNDGVAAYCSGHIWREERCRPTMLITKNATSARSAPGASADLVWKKPAHVALDRAGPESKPYDRPAAGFVERSIFELFERVALGAPDAGALADGRTTLTYAEVHNEARRLAFAIEERVPTGHAVAVLLPNAPPSVIAVLACLAAGRCCIILNADHPPERNAEILRDAGAYAAVVGGQDCAAASILPDGCAPIDFDAPAPARRWTATTSLGSDDPAIVLYTSGSTGQPKGVVLSQATVLTRTRNNIVAMHLSPADRFLSLGALGTTAGLVASVVALLGGSLQFVMNISVTGASLLLDLIRDQQVTIIWGVPAVLRFLFEADAAPPKLATVRVVRTFGDRLLSTECTAWRAVLPETCHLAITYGQTESTTAQWYVPPDFAADDAALPTGYLLPEHEYVILNDDGTGAPEGEVGELVLRSRYVALGEWKHGAVVTERLRPDPVDSKRRILPTGDLVRLRRDGLLQIISRVDRQVKINGQRVELAEVENALRRVQGTTAAVTAMRREGGEGVLLAFIVAADPTDLSLPERARAAVSKSLPTYMQPARILVIDKFPLMPGGKVDEKALLAIADATHPERQHALHAPAATPRVRRAVGRAWMRTLDRESLRTDTPFNEAGGDSLDLLKFVFFLEQESRSTLPLDTFYALLRPSEYAERLDGHLGSAPVAENRAAIPLFLMPGMVGDEPRLVHFRAACGMSLRVVPVAYGNWPEWVADDLDLMALVQRLVAVIETAEPYGPLFLAGYSLGGYVAYLTAATLSAAGRSVAFLGILDAESPVPKTGESHVAPAPMARRQKWQQLLGGMRRGYVARSLAGFIYFGLVRRLVSARWAPLLRLAARVGCTPLPGSIGFHLRYRLNRDLMVEMVRRQRVQMAGSIKQSLAPTVLFRCSSRPAEAAEDLGWRLFCPNLSIVPVDGNHTTMFDPPYLQPLAEQFTASIEHAVATVRA
jgi:amino acid adenylation domain-containing protein